MPRAKRTTAASTANTLDLSTGAATGVAAATEATVEVTETAASLVVEAVETAAETDDRAAVEAVSEAPVVETKPATKKRTVVALKCSVNQVQLKSAFDRVRGSLPTRKSLPNPAIGMYRLVASRSKKTLTITTYNEVVATTVSIPANVVVEGELLASRDLYDLVCQLPDAGITLSAELPNQLMAIMDSRTFSPTSKSADSYPSLLTLDDEADADDGEQTNLYEVNADVFRNALEFVCPGALTEGADAETSIYGSVRLDLWKATGNKKTDLFALAASDDSALVVDEASVVADATVDRKTPHLTACIPVKSLEILSKLLEEAEEETLQIAFRSATAGGHATLCLFKCGGRELLTHLVTNKWPDYLNHIPSANDFQSQVVADRELLLSLVNCNLVFAIAKTFRTMMLDASSQDGVISTWVKTSKGESVQEMVATVNALNGANLEDLKPLAFNASEVKMALGLFGDTEIHWRFINPAAPTMLSGGTKGRWIILMPISVKDDSELPEATEPKATKKKGKK